MLNGLEPQPLVHSGVGGLGGGVRGRLQGSACCSRSGEKRRRTLLLCHNRDASAVAVATRARNRGKVGLASGRVCARVTNCFNLFSYSHRGANMCLSVGTHRLGGAGAGGR